MEKKHRRRYDLGGQVSEGFTIIAMRELLNKQFPDSFGFKVFPHKFGTTSSPDYDKASFYGLEDSDIKGKLYFPPYKRDHEINFTVHQGGENTYFDFLLMAEDGNYYVGTFGFKDRGDVPSDYITKFLALLMEAYGLPFRVNHSVYKSGGMMEKCDDDDDDDDDDKYKYGGEVKYFLVKYSNQPATLIKASSKDEAWRKYSDSMRPVYGTLSKSRAKITQEMAHGGMTHGWLVGEEIVAGRKMYFIYNERTGDKRGLFDTKREAEMEINKASRTQRRRLK